MATKAPLEVINRPTTRWSLPDFREIWRYRFLLYNLVLRELLIRYKQTILGFGWAIFTPILTIIVFTFVFRGIANVPSYGIPYPIFAYAALVPWTLFANGLTFASTSIVSNGALISRMYFPRLLAPLAKQFSGLVDTIIAFALLIVLMAFYGYFPTINILWVPVFLLITLATSLGLGLWLCSIHVRFRDIGPAVPFLVQLWLYVSPVAYPTQLINEDFRVLYGLNPMVSVCDGFRWALLGVDSFHLPTLLVSAGAALLILLSGTLYFQRMEGSFPDYL